MSSPNPKHSRNISRKVNVMRSLLCFNFLDVLFGFFFSYGEDYI